MYRCIVIDDLRTLGTSILCAIDSLGLGTKPLYRYGGTPVQPL